MKNLKYSLPLFALFLLIVSSQTPLLAQTPDDSSRLAGVAGSGRSVRWDVLAPNAGSRLTISTPDGQVLVREFKAGVSPDFTFTDMQGEKFPDGVYTYELRLSPVLDKEVKEALVAARKSGDEDKVVRSLRKQGALPTQTLVQSGSFSILNGSVIVPGSLQESGQGRIATETPVVPRMTPARLAKLRQHHLSLIAPFDQVIPDDLIVQGSICAGLDCVNNENFGFDTIRVKENNTRIQFDDTSSSAGFATNNWQIRANDSGSGGGSFLAFVDQGATANSETGTIIFEVDAGAPANSLRVSSSGNVGVGTATPVLDVHANTTDTPAMRFEQNNSGGFTAQTWDVGANEANFFVRDVTGGSKLSLRIRPGAPTSSLDIAANGNVGIGSGTPRARVDIKQIDDTFIGGLQMRRSTTNDTWAFVTGADNNLYFGYANNASLGDAHADFTVFPLVLTANNRVGIGTTAPDQKLSVNGDASKVGGGSWQTFSDERLKNIRGPFNSGLKAVMRLQPLRYQYRPNNALGIPSNGEHIGFGAEAVQKVIPEAVTKSASGYLMVNNDPILWTMLNAIKEQQKQIDDLKREVRQLRAKTSRKR